MNTPKIPPESGVLLVDKEQQWTSHDVVDFIRKRFQIKKVGHCGTLDPAATGLLVIVMGRATKLSAMFMDQGKKYEGVMQLGVETSTQDSEGEIISRNSIEQITEERIRNTIASFIGELSQIPPMTSAVKQNGKRLYKMAHQGQNVERKARTVHIHNITIRNIDLPNVEMEVSCSKGTYVRTLFADIGEELGCGGYVENLRRTQSGQFHVGNAHSLEALKSWDKDTLLNNRIPFSEFSTSSTGN